MRARAVAITSALLISPIVSKKEMSTDCPNWEQFSATEIGAAHRLKNNNYTDRKRQKGKSQCITAQNNCILNNCSFLVKYRTHKDPFKVNYASYPFLLCITAKNIL